MIFDLQVGVLLEFQAFDQKQIDLIDNIHEWSQFKRSVMQKNIQRLLDWTVWVIKWRKAKWIYLDSTSTQDERPITVPPFSLYRTTDNMNIIQNFLANFFFVEEDV